MHFNDVSKQHGAFFGPFTDPENPDAPRWRALSAELNGDANESPSQIIEIFHGDHARGSGAYTRVETKVN